MISGALVSMPLTGKLIGHYGSDRMARIAALGFPVTLIGIALAPAFGWLIVAAAGFGLWKGMLDVSVNAQAITVENAMGRPVMGGFQGCGCSSCIRPLGREPEAHWIGRSSQANSDGRALLTASSRIWTPGNPLARSAACAAIL